MARRDPAGPEKGTSRVFRGGSWRGNGSFCRAADRRGFIPGRRIGIVGWPRPEAMAFIRDLTEHATQPEFVYSHQWTQHDLVIWDNRCTMHRRDAFPGKGNRRMHRLTTISERPY